VVANLDHELRFQRLPLRRAAGGPSARTARRATGEPRRRDEFLELQRERLFVGRRDRRGEAHVVEEAVLAVGAEQEGADHGFALVVPEAPDHAVGAAIVLDLLHPAAFARAIVEIAALGDDAVEQRANVFEPALCFAQAGRGRDSRMRGLALRYRWAKL